MKRIIYLSVVILNLFMIGCTNEPFNYSLYQPSASAIDSIYLSTGAKKLIADGHATLRFVVETYRKYQVKTATGTRDSMVFVDYNLLPAGSVKIFDGTGKEVGMTYKTTDATPGSISFYAQVGNTKSVIKTVTLRPQPVLPPKLVVDVIFHVFEQSTTDKFYDPATYQPVTKEILDAAIKDLNDVMNNKLGDSPNGASANIEFRMATTNAAGAKLAVPGMDVYTYNSTAILVNPNATGYSVGDFIAFINKTPSMIWDPKKFLNTYIMPTGANNAMYYQNTGRASYQMVPAGQVALPGMLTPATYAYVGAVAPAVNPPLPTFATYPNGVVPNETIVPQYYETAGLGIARTVLFPGMNKRITMSDAVGRYYGVLGTQSSSTTYTDYCTDTNIYSLTNAAIGNNTNSLTKTGLNGEKFLADNAMDDIRYASLRNSFTLDQVYRIRWIITNGPKRNHGILVP